MSRTLQHRILVCEGYGCCYPTFLSASIFVFFLDGRAVFLLSLVVLLADHVFLQRNLATVNIQQFKEKRARTCECVS